MQFAPSALALVLEIDFPVIIPRQQFIKPAAMLFPRHDSHVNEGLRWPQDASLNGRFPWLTARVIKEGT